jgi:hypothetical protein
MSTEFLNPDYDKDVALDLFSSFAVGTVWEHGSMHSNVLDSHFPEGGGWLKNYYFCRGAHMVGEKCIYGWKLGEVRP